METKKTVDRAYLLALWVALGLLWWLEPAWAVTVGTMPWEGPLDTLMDSVTGPVAMVISLLGVTVCGGMLIFGGELGEFTRRAVMLVMVIALLTGSAGIITTLFGGATALVL